MQDSVLDEEQFQTKVLNGVETLVKSYDRLDKETKKSFEEMTKLKRVANDQAANMDRFMRSLRDVESNLRREARAFGDPIQRIANNEELRDRLNARVRSVLNAPMTEAHKKALGEDSSPGSTLIDDELNREIYDTLAMNGRWSTLGVRPMGTKQTKFAVKTVRPVALVLTTEAAELVDDANKAGTSVTAEAEVIGVLLNVSMQLLEDAVADVTADVLEDFTEAFNYRLDWCAFSADGTADTTDGGMTGVFEYGTAAAAGAGNTTIAALDLPDFVRCLTTVDSAVLTRQARWWMHPYSLARTLNVRDENGRPIFLTAIEAPSFGGIGSILGYPVTLVDAAPSTDAASAKVAAFGDPNGMVVGIRRSFAFESSDHHKWNTFQRSFRGVGRAGVKGRRSQAFSILTLAAV